MPRHPEHPCIELRVDPLLRELRAAVTVRRVAPEHPGRAELETFIRAVFRAACDARVECFFPELLAFEADAALRAVVGCRPAAGESLFVEQYLDRPAHRLIAERLGRPVRREDLAEVGNLALAYPGQARWVIAATTAFLAAAGFRWVVFTAARPLFNAFRRLGLSPVRLAAADPARLPDRGRSWGRYYAAEPHVYAGDIRAGLARLSGAAWSRQLHARTLLSEARLQGRRVLSDAAAWRPDAAQSGGR